MCEDKIRFMFSILKKISFGIESEKHIDVYGDVHVYMCKRSNSYTLLQDYTLQKVIFVTLTYSLSYEMHHNNKRHSISSIVAYHGSRNNIHTIYRSIIHLPIWAGQFQFGAQCPVSRRTHDQDANVLLLSDKVAKCIIWT